MADRVRLREFRSEDRVRVVLHNFNDDGFEFGPLNLQRHRIVVVRETPPDVGMCPRERSPDVRASRSTVVERGIVAVRLERIGRR